jgi:uncharacterized protein involved in exopolysaccharide biosynthesis
MGGRGDWTNGTAFPSARTEARPVRARYGMVDLTGLVWRERLTMLLVFAVILAAGTAFALTLPKTYTAHAAITVNLGQEYVYQPRAGDAGRGAAPQKDQVVQSEAQILNSDELKRRVIAAVGLETIDPKLAAAWRQADGIARREIEGSALKVLRRGLSVGTAPDTGVIQLDFQHQNPDAAAKILNTLLSTYFVYRREVFADVTTPMLERQRDDFEQRLEQSDEAYEAFLRRNGVSDFTTEKATLAANFQAVSDDKFKTEAALYEVQGKLATVKARIGEAPREIATQRDLDLANQTKLRGLLAERQDLLSRYTADAEPVKDVDSKINELQALITSGYGDGEKDRRMGPNPVWQDLESQRIGLEAQQTALQQRLAGIDGQLARLKARQMTLVKLESEYQSLAVDRDVLQTNLRSFAGRAEENRAAEEMSRGAQDNIRIIDRASPPAEGKSLKKPIFILAFLFAAFTALCAALFRVFTRKGIATPTAASRTLDLPVLAVAPLKG